REAGRKVGRLGRLPGSAFGRERSAAHPFLAHVGQQGPERRSRRPPAQGSLLLVRVSRCADLSTNPRPRGGPCLETLALPGAPPPAQHEAQDAGPVALNRAVDTPCDWQREPPVIGTLRRPGPDRGAREGRGYVIPSTQVCTFGRPFLFNAP